MTDWTLLVNFAMAVSGLVLTSLGLILSVACRPIERWTRSYFIANFSIMFIGASAITVDYYAGIFHMGGLVKVLIFIESVSSSLLMPLLTVYLLKLCGESWRKSTLFLWVIGLWVSYMVLLIYTQFTSVIYSVSAQGVYSRGPLYPLLLVSPAAIMLLNLIGLIRRWNTLTPRLRKAVSVYIAAPLAAIILQMFFYGLLLVTLSVIIGAYVLFVFILLEQTDIAISRARESAEKEFGLKVLQMRPHFIYNAMTSIYYLVDTEPQAAKEAIRDFSRYLHQNFSAVVKTENIPFEEELAHTRAYLTIEKTRFGDRLDVAYDTPSTMFSLPPLTLQPIVENAVKHGKDPYAGPFHLTIRTQKTASGSEVVVADNGRGFNHADNGEPHIALKNIQQRLEIMCGGTLEITSREGGGTVVTVTIPDDRQEKA